MLSLLTANKARELVSKYERDEPKRVKEKLKAALYMVKTYARFGDIEYTADLNPYRQQVESILIEQGFNVYPEEHNPNVTIISWKERRP